VNNFNPSAVKGVMCRDTISVGWDGQLFDCDFNQQLALKLGEDLEDLGHAANAELGRTQGGLDVFSVDTLDFAGTDITVDHHCFGCTAGAGSSCQGTTI
jgi:hypothetical protein